MTVAAVQWREEFGRRRLTSRHVIADHGNDALLDLAEAGHLESRFGDIPFSRVKAQRQLDAALADRRRHLLIVADVGGRPEGFVFASVGGYFVGTGALLVRREYRYGFCPGQFDDFEGV
jgi:hypothetical protein